MFENLRDVFREAVASFKEGLYQDEGPDVPLVVDRVLIGMRREIADAKGTLSGLRGQIDQARAQALSEGQEEATCRRREEMARRIGDEDTARLAAEYGARHAHRRSVLERKVAALEEERAMRQGEVEEMVARLTEAQQKRDALAAAGGDAHESVRAADDLFEELDRMAGDMGDPVAERRRRTVDDIEREYQELRVDPWAASNRPSEADVDAALEELKRRMGKG